MSFNVFAGGPKSFACDVPIARLMDSSICMHCLNCGKSKSNSDEARLARASCASFNSGNLFCWSMSIKVPFRINVFALTYVAQ